MHKPPFDPSEFDVIGTRAMAPGTVHFIENVGMPMPEAGDVILNRHITAKQNFKMLFSGQVPYWMPYRAFLFQDTQWFYPRQLPDVWADHMALDGGDPVDFEGTEYRSWFDIDWVYVPVVGGATVKPGSPRVPDMSHWEDYISMPDLDKIDWKGMHDMNVGYLSSDRFTAVDMYNGPWERMISLMDVEGACVALVDDDQQEGVHRFLDQYTDFYCDLIRRILANCDLDCVLVHDDWGHQNGAFFSHEVAEEFFFEPLCRIVDCVHEAGAVFERHSCGRNELFTDLYVKAGVDFYAPQGINDMDRMLEDAKGSNLVIAMPDPDLAPDASAGQIREAAAQWFDKYKDYRIAQGFMATPQEFSDEIYRLSRMYYQDK